MAVNFRNGLIIDAVSQLYSFLQIFDDIAISCSESVINARVPALFFGAGNNFIGEQFLQNILYNLGFQITDILDLIFYDTNDKNPFWYYVFYRVGDFIVRFIYRDESP